jgi:hypothetical protein
MSLQIKALATMLDQLFQAETAMQSNIFGMGNTSAKCLLSIIDLDSNELTLV